MKRRDFMLGTAGLAIVGPAREQVNLLNEHSELLGSLFVWDNDPESKCTYNKAAGKDVVLSLGETNFWDEFDVGTQSFYINQTDSFYLEPRIGFSSVAEAECLALNMINLAVELGDTKTTRKIEDETKEMVSIGNVFRKQHNAPGYYIVKTTPEAKEKLRNRNVYIHTDPEYIGVASCNIPESRFSFALINYQYIEVVEYV